MSFLFHFQINKKQAHSNSCYDQITCKRISQLYRSFPENFGDKRDTLAKRLETRALDIEVTVLNVFFSCLLVSVSPNSQETCAAQLDPLTDRHPPRHVCCLVALPPLHIQLGRRECHSSERCPLGDRSCLPTAPRACVRA